MRGFVRDVGEGSRVRLCVCVGGRWGWGVYLMEEGEAGWLGGWMDGLMNGGRGLCRVGERERRGDDGVPFLYSVFYERVLGQGPATGRVECLD
jgi:hypothetical protein